MTMKLVLDVDAHRFMKVLRSQVEDMEARYDDTQGVNIWLEEYWEGRSGYDVAMVLIDDGLLYKAEVFIGHPVFKDMDPSDCEGRGVIPLEVTPLDRDIHAPPIQVRIDYDPSHEHTEVLPYVIELFEGLVSAWPAVRSQLAEQSGLFDAQIKRQHGPAEQPHMPTPSTSAESDPEDEISDEVRELLNQKLKKNRGKFGTYGSLNEAEVRAIVKRCRHWMRQGGTAIGFHEQFAHDPSNPPYFALETLRGWMTDTRFAVQDDE